MRLFGHAPVVHEAALEENQQVLDKQRKESRETLAYVRQVLAKKDELLAEAVNQTGEAVRRKPKRYRGAHH